MERPTLANMAVTGAAPVLATATTAAGPSVAVMPSPDTERPTEPQDAYEATGGDHQPVLVFRRADSDPGAAPQMIASHADDPRVGWSDPDGVQTVAQAILEHHTGSEPDQAALEALVMDRGDLWAANATWTLSVGELDRILERP